MRWPRYFDLHATGNFHPELDEPCEWSDLKANPSKLLQKYFDAVVCVANWGTHEFSPSAGINRLEVLEAMGRAILSGCEKPRHS
jgi:hypothetical protein